MTDLYKTKLDEARRGVNWLTSRGATYDDALRIAASEHYVDQGDLDDHIIFYELEELSKENND